MNELFAKHTGTYVEDEKPDVGFDDELSKHMLNSDPPYHTRLRGLVSKAFTLRRMEGFRPRIHELVENMLDAIEGKDEVDLVAEYAQPLPINLICDVLGIPFGDREMFARWAIQLVGAGQPPEVVEAASRSVYEYGKKVIAEKREHPEDDMMSALARGMEDDRLTDIELTAMIFLFTVAGHITSQHTLSNGVLALLEHPAELEKLRADPSLIPSAIDELMRYDGPVGVATFRFTAEPVQIGDVTIPADQIVALSMLSAHRDETKFPDPNRLDVTRRPNGVLAFGHGPHFCIGQPLAKIQTEVGLTRLLARFPHLRLAADPKTLKWESSALLRGVITLPVSVSPPSEGA
jgi:cytochrome P450